MEKMHEYVQKVAALKACAVSMHNPHTLDLGKMEDSGESFFPGFHYRQLKE